MIGFLKGRILGKAPNRILLDVHGVGFELQVPLTTFRATEALDDQDEMSLFVHTHVKEDAISLFGFATEMERDLFRPLLSVKGVGPKLALAVLSDLTAPELVQALARGDTARLNRVSGIGKKTAQQIVLELSEKAQEWPAVPVATGLAVDEDLVGALLQLGYRGGEARDAVSTVRSTQPDASLEESLRLCLRQLARR